MSDKELIDKIALDAELDRSLVERYVDIIKRSLERQVRERVDIKIPFICTLEVNQKKKKYIDEAFANKHRNRKDRD